MMSFDPSKGTPSNPLSLGYHKPDGELRETVTIHPHAMRQICAKVSLPTNYAKLLSEHTRGRLLLSLNLSELFSFDEWLSKDGRKIKFLHRIVDGQLRGFISRRFNRHLVSGPMLHAFSVACDEVGETAIDASSNDVRFRVKAALPYVFEPVKNVYCMLGVEWSNSDFGAGALEVTTFLHLPAQGHFVTLSGFRRVHIGSVTDTTDDAFEEAQFSEDTYRAEVEAQSSAIRDAVVSQLNEKCVESLLDSVVASYDAQLPWGVIAPKIKAVAGSKMVDQLKRAMDDGIDELPSIPKDRSGVPQPTRFWAMAACGWLADKEVDSEKRAALEAIGGSMLLDKAA